MKSYTYGEVSMNEMIEIINNYIKDDENSDYTVSVGTDSQNHELTKMVVVIAIHRHGKGGIFFYDIKYEPKITNIKQKIYYETSLSLDIASKIAECFADNNIQENIEVHVDIGNSKFGKTKDLITEIVGWVEGAGYNCKIKPESYAASWIANKISK